MPEVFRRLSFFLQMHLNVVAYQDSNEKKDAQDIPEAQYANTDTTAPQSCPQIVEYLTAAANWICLTIISLQPKAQDVGNLYLRALAKPQLFIICVRIKQPGVLIILMKPIKRKGSSEKQYKALFIYFTPCLKLQAYRSFLTHKIA